MIRTTVLPEQFQLGAVAIEVDTYPAWREAARKLVAKRVEPDEVFWLDRSAPHQLLLGMESASSARAAAALTDPVSHAAACHDPSLGAAERQLTFAPSASGPDVKLRVPKGFARLAADIACHRDPRRWDLLYRVLWRLTHGEPSLLDIVTDDDVHPLLQLQREVLREAEAAKSEIRFRRVGAGAAGHYLAWHRPRFRILELLAPYFQRRFGVMTWSIFTPEQSMHWNGECLLVGEGADMPAAASTSSVLEDAEVERWWAATGNAVLLQSRALPGDPLIAAGRTQATTNDDAVESVRGIRHKSQSQSRRKKAVPASRGKTAARVKAAPRAAGPHAARRATLATSAEDFLPPRADDLEALAKAAQTCEGCSLYQNATQTVFGAGSDSARIVFVGEQPGDYEDRRGEPFVGPAGKLLDEILAEVGIDRSNVYVTNAVKHFKWTAHGKRRLHAKPSSREVTACRPWLEAELSAIRPQILVCLGATASSALLGAGHRVTQEHGRVFASEWAPATMVTYHPSAILRAMQTERGDEMRAQFVGDLKKVARLAKSKRPR